MLKYKVGDLITAAKNNEVQAIAHGCNCYNTMGSGIAPLIAKAFPTAFTADQNTTKGDKGKLGGFTTALSTGTNASGNPYYTRVYNLYSQFGYWGRNKGIMDLDYNALRHALDEMSFDLIKCSKDMYVKVGLPKIGAGLAGGDWEEISKIINETLVEDGHDVTVYVLDVSELPPVAGKTYVPVTATKFAEIANSQPIANWVLVKDKGHLQVARQIRNRTLTTGDYIFIEIL